MAARPPTPSIFRGDASPRADREPMSENSYKHSASESNKVNDDDREDNNCDATVKKSVTRFFFNPFIERN